MKSWVKNNTIPTNIHQRDLNTQFFGLPVTRLSAKEILIQLQTTVIEHKKTVIYGYSFAGVYFLRQYPEVAEMSKSSDICLVDGRPFYWLLKAFKVEVKSSLSIPELVNKCILLAGQNHWKIYLLGATDEINLQAIISVQSAQKGISGIKGRNGYFDEDRCEEIISEINAFQPDLLLLGMSTPKKERITIRFKDQLDARIIIPCGGMIDVLAGKTKITPPLMKKMGLASIYRVFQEPRRLLISRLQIYAFTFFQFIPKLIHQFVKKKDFNILKHYSTLKT